MRSLSLMRRRALFVAVTLALGGCAVGPEYQRPSAPVSATYKEAKDWVPAAPADALDRGQWWTLFNDPVLDKLASSVAVSNQNVAAAAASYDQARALVREQRAALFPVVSLDAGGTRGRNNHNYQVNIGGTWEPDLWGRLRRTVTNAEASAQASAADLASATLSAQGELVSDYISLRQTDAALSLLNATIVGYKRVLDITQNRYAAGVAAKSDLLQAQTQLASAQADAAGLERQRAQFEHAIAVLVGKAPGDFNLPPAAWQPNVPTVPVGVPSTLLQRRPDIAAAERRVAAANEQIGIAKSAYFPSLNLTASVGSTSGTVSSLFGASSAVWALGFSVAQSIFTAGSTQAKVEGAEAGYQASVAHYRQTVLAAFQDVEDQLTAARVLAAQEELRRKASVAADETEAILLNRYKAGQVSYTEVFTVQASALNARRTLVQAQSDRQIAAVALIQALGGGWHAEENK